MHLQQWPDSSWNVTKLFSLEESKSNWRFSFEQAYIKGAIFEIKPLTKSPAVPRRIEDMHVDFSLANDDSGATLELRDLKWRARAPDFALEELSALLLLHGNKLFV